MGEETAGWSSEGGFPVRVPPCHRRVGTSSVRCDMAVPERGDHERQQPQTGDSLLRADDDRCPRASTSKFVA
eukprot:1130751-Alexandrium_andersonii.AAC.1